MRRYFVNQNGNYSEIYSPREAQWVMIEKDELDKIEQKLKNKTEEAARWAKKLTGEDQKYRLILVDYIRKVLRSVGHNSAVEEPTKVYVTISLPIPADPTAKNQAKALVERVFSAYISEYRRYKLHWAPKAGWSVNLELTEEEFDTFQLPES